MIRIDDYTTPSPDQWRIVIKGMRNAYKSWDRADSYLIYTCIKYDMDGYHGILNLNNNTDIDKKFSDVEKLECLTDEDSIINFYLGKADKNLLLSLSELGASDRKALRQLQVILEVEAPLYWWKQADKYQVGTVTNSESTMHTITKKEFQLSDFSYDNFVAEHRNFYKVSEDFKLEMKEEIKTTDFMQGIIKYLNDLRKNYLETKDKRYWTAIIQFLPESYNQTRTLSLNYEVLLNIYFQRRNHELEEWRIFCIWLIENIPLFKEIVEIIEEKNEV